MLIYPQNLRNKHSLPTEMNASFSPLTCFLYTISSKHGFRKSLFELDLNLVHIVWKVDKNVIALHKTFNSLHRL